jgi:hypothetical protein
MPRKQILWIHPASYTYSTTQPARLLETLWCERAGWGYLKRRDMWIKKEVDPAELHAAGYQPKKPPSDPSVSICPHCGMYMSGIPGSLINKHKSLCGGLGENWQVLEEALVSDMRMMKYEQKIANEKRRQQEELELAERMERQDKIKETFANRQLQKDRKKRLKQQTKEQLMNR